MRYLLVGHVVGGEVSRSNNAGTVDEMKEKKARRI
jgi:hypothetical protein